MRYPLLTLALLCNPMTALAYGPCDEDTKKLCENGDFHSETTKNCLHFNLAQVQDQMCKDFLQKEHSAWQQSVGSFAKVQAACKAELEKNCPELQDSGRRFKAQQTCLMSDGEKLSKACKGEMNRHIREFQSSIREIE